MIVLSTVAIVTVQSAAGASLPVSPTWRTIAHTMQVLFVVEMSLRVASTGFYRCALPLPPLLLLLLPLCYRQRHRPCQRCST